MVHPHARLMMIPLRTLSWLLLPLFAASAVAQEPVDKPVEAYRTLWTSSPFTTPPPPGEGPAEVNPMDDYALSAVSPVAGGYMVVIVNKKDPSDRIRIVSGQPSEFTIEKVIPGEGPRETVVELSHGTKKGKVEFDEKLLVIRQAPPPRPQPNPNQPVPNQPAPNVQPNAAVPAGQQPQNPAQVGQAPGGNNPNARVPGNRRGTNPNAAGTQDTQRRGRPRVLPNNNNR
jgi:hypothetical protein